MQSAELSNLRLEDGMPKVLGKGNKERLIPIGKNVQRLWYNYRGKVK